VDIANWEAARDLRQQQLMAMGIKEKYTHDAQRLEKHVDGQLRAFRNHLKAAQYYHPERPLLKEFQLKKSWSGLPLGKLLEKAATAYRVAATDPALLAITTEFGFDLSRIQLLQAEVEALRDLNEEQEQSKGVSQRRTDHFYDLLEKLRQARAALRLLALETFADDPQILKELALGPIPRD